MALRFVHESGVMPRVTFRGGQFCGTGERCYDTGSINKSIFTVEYL